MVDYTEYFSFKNKDEPIKVSDSRDYSPSTKEGVIGFLLGTVGYMLCIPLILQIVYFSLSGVEAAYLDANTSMLISVVIQLVGGFISLAIMFFWISKKLIPFIRKEITSESIGYAVVIFIVSLIASVIWGIISTMIWPDTTTNANEASVESIITTFPLLAVIFTCILAPIIEELTFRLYLFKSLEKKSPIVAIIVTTFVFAAVHMISSLTYVMTAEGNITFYESASNNDVPYGTSFVDTGDTGAVAKVNDVVQFQFGSGVEQEGTIQIIFGDTSIPVTLDSSDDTAYEVAYKVSNIAVTNWETRNYEVGDEYVNFIYKGEEAVMSCGINDVSNTGVKKAVFSYLAYEFTQEPTNTGDIKVTIYGREWVVNVDAETVNTPEQLASCVADSVSLGYIGNDFKSLPSYLISSLCFTLAYYKTRKLSVSIFAHMFNNIFAVVASLLFANVSIGSVILKPELFEVILSWLRTFFHIG